MTDQTKKQNAGKAPVYQGCLMYFPRAIKKVAEVSAFGREKYQSEWETQGWRDVPIGDLQDALARHMLDRAIDGEVNEADGKCLHLAQQAWEALASLEVYLVSQEKHEKHNPFANVAAEVLATRYRDPEYEDCAEPKRLPPQPMPHVFNTPVEEKEGDER